MTEQHKRAVVYARESQGKVKSVDDQIRLALAAIDEQGWEHAGTYSDGSSASRYARKGRGEWARLRAEIDAGRIGKLLLWESSRGSRDPIDWFVLLDSCRRHGVLIHVISHEHTYDLRRARDWQALATDGVTAAHEADMVSARTKRGARQAALAGRPHGKHVFGYERVYDPATRELVEQRPHPEQAEIVREIIRRVGALDPIMSIQADLQARGVPSPDGRRWTRQTIRRIALSRTYVGERTHHGDRHAAVWPRLVSDEEHDAAVAVLTGPGRQRSKAGRQQYLLSYIAVATCGAALHGHPAGPGRLPRYRCMTPHGCASVDMPTLDSLVVELVVRRLCQPDAREIVLADGDGEAARAARDEAARLRTELREAQKLAGLPVGQGGISVASMARIEANLTPQIQAAENRAVSATVPRATLTLLDAAEVGAEYVRPAWDSLPLPARRELLASWVRVVVAPAARRLSRWASAGERLAAAAERTEITWR